MINFSDISLYDTIRGIFNDTYLEYNISNIVDNGNGTYTLTLTDIGILGYNTYIYYVTITDTPNVNGTYAVKSIDTTNKTITITLESGAVLSSYGNVQFKAVGYINTQPETVKTRKTEKSTKAVQIFPIIWIPEPLDIIPVMVEGSKNNTVAYHSVSVDSIFIMDYYDYKTQGNASDEQIISNMTLFANKFMQAAKNEVIDIDFDGYKPHRRWGSESSNAYIGLELSGMMAGIEISGLTLDIVKKEYCLT